MSNTSDLKVIFVSLAKDSYIWEVHTLITSLKEVGFNLGDVIWLCYGDAENAKTIKDTYGCQVHHYHDLPDMVYPSSVRPYLLHKYFSDHLKATGEEYTYIYVDSDIIFNHNPHDWDFTGVSTTRWIGTETAWYAGITHCNNLHPGFKDKVQSTLDPQGNAMRKIEDNLPGAQWVLKVGDPEIFQDIYLDCEKLYQALLDMDVPEQETRNYKNTIWMTDMWAFPITATQRGISVEVQECMEMTLMCDRRVNNQKALFFHNSGYAGEQSAILTSFTKGIFRNKLPQGHTFVVSEHVAVADYLHMLVKAGFDNTIVEYGGGYSRLRNNSQGDPYDFHGVIMGEVKRHLD